MCASVYICVLCACRNLQRSEENVRSPGMEVMRYNMGAGSKTQVVHKSNKCFLTTEPPLQLPDGCLFIHSFSQPVFTEYI